MIVKFIEKFSPCPADREHASQLREEVLKPLVDSLPASHSVIIDLDGGPGYAASFLEELFGGYSRIHGLKLKSLVQFGQILFMSNEDPDLIAEIRGFIDKGADFYLQSLFFNHEKPRLADIPQEVYDELQLYKTCYEYLRQWQKEWDSSESGGQHIYFRRMQLAKDTRELLAEVEKMQEQQGKAQA